MPKIEKEEKAIIVKREMKKYSPQELQEFNDKAQVFYKNDILDLKSLKEDFGAVNKDGAIILRFVGKDKDGKNQYERPNKLQEFENLYDQWQFWKGRSEYISSKEMEALQDIADTIGTNF